MTTYEEWRVTGTDEYGRPIDVIYEHDEDRNERRARGFVDWAQDQGWLVGPHLHKRTVTVTDWEEA